MVYYGTILVFIVGVIYSLTPVIIFHKLNGNKINTSLARSEYGYEIVNHDSLSMDPSYQNVLKSMSQLNFFRQKELPSHIEIQNLPLCTLLWLMRDAILSKLTYLLNDEEFKHVLQQRKTNSRTINIHENILNILSSSDRPEYNKMYIHMITYIPKQTIILLEGTSSEMITAYFQETNVITFAFRGTDLTNTPIKDLYDDYFIFTKGETKRSVELLNICETIIEKFSDKKPLVQTTGYSLGGAISLEIAFKLKVICVGINIGGGRVLSEVINKMAENNGFVHIHNSNDILSNNLLHETISERFYHFSRHILKNLNIKYEKEKKYRIPIISVNKDRIRRQNLKYVGLFDDHSLENVILEIEEVLLEKFF